MKRVSLILISLLLTLTISLSVVSCKKEPLKCTEITEAPNEFLRYWFFPVGSYWVYQLRDTTGVYDTVRVVYNEIKHFEPTAHTMDQVPCSQRYYSLWQHSNEDYFNPTPYQDAFFNLESYFNSPNNWSVSFNSQVDYYGFPYMFEFPYQAGKNMNIGAYLESIDSLITPKGTFFHTLHIRPTTNLFEKADTNIADYPNHIYLSPDIGISRIEYTHNQKWELVDYHIVK